MKRDKLVREVGNWVEGDRFWDRERETEDFIRLLDEGAHILLVAPRRTGKTSLMREVMRQIQDRYHCLFTDVEKARGPADAIVELSLATRPFQSLWGRTKAVFKNALVSIDSVSLDELTIKLQDGLLGDWRAKGDRLLEELASDHTPVVVFIDELPILVNRMLLDAAGEPTAAGRSEVDLFVSWLRSAAQRHRGRLRIVVSGSIGLGPVLARAGLSATINELTPYHLEPWSDDDAVGCLEALAANYDVQYVDGAARALVATLGWCVPHHVQMFFSHVYDDSRKRRDRRIGPRDVERVYRARMLSTRGHAELSHMEERLRIALGARRHTLALDLLTEAAVTGVLTPGQATTLAREHDLGDGSRYEVDRVIGILEHDGYLVAGEAGHAFQSPLLRDWWRARFGASWATREER